MGQERAQEEARQPQEPPADVYNAAYSIFFLLGLGFLLPWNVFITAVDYFDFLYPGKHIDRVFSVIYILPSLVAIVLLTLFGRHYSAFARINIGLCIFLLAIVLVPLLDALVIQDGGRGVAATYYSTNVAVVATGLADALVQASLFGTAAELPERYMQALIAGTAGSGVLVSFLRIATKAVFPQTPQGLRASANLYFIVAVVFMVVCIVCYNAVGALPVMRYHRDVFSRAKAPEAASLLWDGEPRSSNGDVEHAAREATTVVHGDSHKVTDLVIFQQVVGKVKWFAAALVLIYVVTLAIFPGYLTEDVKSEALGDWYPILLVALYNVFDLVGKSITPYYTLHDTVVIGACVARLLFFPLFAACLHGPAVLRTELPVAVLTALLGVSNGYLTSCLMVSAPKSVPIEDAEAASMTMVLFLILGLAIGCVAGWVWIL